MRKKMQAQTRIDLRDLIADPYIPVLQDISRGGHTYYDLYGGRGSGKSSFVGLMLIIGLMQDPSANAAVFRKVANTLSTSVFEQCIWALQALGVADYWKVTQSPMRLTYVTGQVILFRGLDKAQKLKSIKVAHGYIKYLWFEELDEFSGEEEIRSVQQSVLRGGPSFRVFKTFNPPISQSNWANQYVMRPRDRTLRLKSSYLDMPRAWLGEQFIFDAEELKEINPRAYEHEYLGNPVGTGGEVFENLEIREIPASERLHFDRIVMGIDWGWYPDPFHWSKCHFDAARRILYIIDEYRVNRMSNRDTWQALQAVKGVRTGDLITADSAEPKSVADYRSYGSSCRAAVKGPDSVRYGIKWLQSLTKIVIDPVSCPYTAAEFSKYEYERTRNGDVVSAFQDRDNHSIDSVRYATEHIWSRKGQ